MQSLKQKKKPTFEKKFKYIESNISLNLVKSNSQKNVAPFSKSKVERDLNHWQDVKKYDEYNENPGP